MLERRFISRVELRATESAKGPIISGYAARFLVLSADLGGFREKLAPGCFTRALRDPKTDVKALLNHDPSRLLGRQRNGTLTVSEDNFGLQFSCLLPNTRDGQDVFALVNRGDLSECSFAFNAEEQDWEDGTDPDTGEACAIRTIRSVGKLLDVSVVSSPAYPQTSVQTNSAAELVMGRNLFPEGVPMEVRSHVPTLRSHREQRRRFMDIVLGL